MLVGVIFVAVVAVGVVVQTMVSVADVIVVVSIVIINSIFGAEQWRCVCVCAGVIIVVVVSTSFVVSVSYGISTVVGGVLGTVILEIDFIHVSSKSIECEVAGFRVEVGCGVLNVGVRPCKNR